MHLKYSIEIIAIFSRSTQKEKKDCGIHFAEKHTEILLAGYDTRLLN